MKQRVELHDVRLTRRDPRDYDTPPVDSRRLYIDDEPIEDVLGRLVRCWERCGYLGIDPREDSAGIVTLVLESNDE